MMTPTKILCALAAAGVVAMAAMPAQALTMQECSAKYKAAKSAGTLNGQRARGTSNSATAYKVFVDRRTGHEQVVLIRGMEHRIVITLPDKTRRLRHETDVLIQGSERDFYRYGMKVSAEAIVRDESGVIRNADGSPRLRDDTSQPPTGCSC